MVEKWLTAVWKIKVQCWKLTIHRKKLQEFILDIWDVFIFYKQ